MSFWQKILNFINSDLYLYICLGSFLCCVIILAILKLIEYFLGRKNCREFTQLLHKYGLPEEINCPEYVLVHILHLISLAEEYNLDSLYEAQEKFEDLYCCYFKSITLSEEENRRIQCEGYLKTEKDIK